jgi:hypothetical protein
MHNAELRGLIEACLRRGTRPIPLPHCAICARYAHENLPFEAILALIDALPAGEAAATTALVERELAALPAAYRQQQVTDVTFAALLSAPSWPLVRSLVVDLYGEQVERFFVDPRLAQIEQITLLGGAYGGPDISLEFLKGLTESPALTSVRKLTLHSGDVDDDGRALFWASPLAARLEEIEGVPYQGEPVPRPLRAKVITGLSFWRRESAPALQPLLSPATSPHLERTSLFGADASDGALTALQAALDPAARLRSVSAGFWQVKPEHFAGLQRIRWPKCVEDIHGLPEFRNDTFYLDCDMLNVALADKHDGEQLQGCDCLTSYGGTLFELDATAHLSRGLKKLIVIVPPDRSVAEIISLGERLSQLDEWTIVFPFSRQQALDLARSATVPRLSKLHLSLSLSLGSMTTQYMQDRAAAYHSPLKPREIGELVFGEALRGVQHLTIAGDAIEIARSPQELQHVRLGNPAAAQAFAALWDGRPIETLNLHGPLSVDDLAALRRAGVFSRVYRLSLEGTYDEDALAALAEDPELAHVQVLNLLCYRGLSPGAFASLVNSPHLTSVRDFFFSTDAADAPELLARSRLLPQLVSLGTHVYKGLAALPGENPLSRLRRLDETLTGRLFTDGRQARRWLAVNPSTPLRAALEAFLRRTYSQDGLRSAEQLIADLLAFDRKAVDFDDGERRIYDDTRELLAKVFGGEPVPVGTPFGSLSELQQRALHAIDKASASWWNVNNLMRDPLASYGFDFYQDRFREFLAGKCNSQ